MDLVVSSPKYGERGGDTAHLTCRPCLLEVCIARRHCVIAAAAAAAAAASNAGDARRPKKDDVSHCGTASLTLWRARERALHHGIS